MLPSLKKAIFLDRDGTLNEDPGYLRHPSQLKLLPTVGEALSLFKNAGYLLVVVSNQSGVGRGLIAEDVLPLIHARLDELLLPWAVHIDRYELCTHKPDDQCDCRKPKPKLLLDAAQALQINLSQSYMVGDKISDLTAGHAAGCRGAILVRTGEGAATAEQIKNLQTEGQEGEERQAAFIGNSLLEVAHWILSQETVSS